MLRIQAATLVATFIISTWSMVLLSRHHHRPLLVTNLLALGVAAVAAIALIPPYGAKGAAITTLVTEVFLAGAYTSSPCAARKPSCAWTSPSSRNSCSRRVSPPSSP